MFNRVKFIFNGGEETGYGQHAKHFWSALNRLLPNQDGGNQCNIILDTVNGKDFYQDWKGTKIAFNVWESTRYPDDFFKQLLTFDQLWVPSTWQRDCAIEQGYPEDKVKVIPEGVDGSIYQPNLHVGRTGFNFLHVGKWEDRKSTKEIIEAFLKSFPEAEYPNVRLHLSVDTNFPTDGMGSTEERLQHFGFNDARLIVHHFSSKEEYVGLLQSTDVFVTCARAQGWNLPLIEAIACGVPSITSQYSAQLDYHNVPELQVKIKEHKKPVNVFNMPDCPGTWAEPDYEDLGRIMKLSYDKYIYFRQIFTEQRDSFVKKWSWDNAAKIAFNELSSLSKGTSDVTFNYHFSKGAFLEIRGKSDSLFHVVFRDTDTGEEVYSTNIKVNSWTRYKAEYFKNISITVIENRQIVFFHRYDATDKKIFITFQSKSLGDSIAWIPYCEGFRKKHNCRLAVSTFYNYLFKNVYPDIEFVAPGTVVHDIYAQYAIGVFHEDREWKNPRDWRTIPLQRTASDILGLEYREIKPEIDMSNVYSAAVKRPKKYICISEFSTADCKLWHYPNAWQILADKFIAMGYNVVSISKEHSNLKNIIKANNNHMDVTMGLISGCEFFVGLASGLAWLSWAMNKPVVMISGFSEPFVEFTTNNIRIAGKGDCTGCDNDVLIPNRAWDEGCFHHKKYACTSAITPDEVIAQIPYLVGDKTLDFTAAPILRTSKRQTTFKDYLTILHENFTNPNLLEIGMVRRLPTDDLYWRAGDGNSTSIFAWYVNTYGGHLESVDIDPVSVYNCNVNLITQGLLTDRISLLEADGLAFLENYSKPIHGIYIDAVDYDEKNGFKNSAEFHLKAFKLAEKNFIPGSIIMFDDVYDANYKGKAELAIPYAIATGNYTIEHQNIQIILRRKC